MIEAYLSQVSQPAPLSHKGQNGKVLIIGGSDLFHAASQWSFLVASRWVDMTFYSSVAENNQLLHEAKLYARDGVVVPRADLLSYAKEANAILMGPGLRRDIPTRFSSQELEMVTPEQLHASEWESDTKALTAAMLHAFPQKRWILDAGALQVLEANWLPDEAILTPHFGELQRLGRTNELEQGSFWDEFERRREALFHQVSSDTALSRAPRMFEDGEIERALGKESIAALKQIASRLKNATFIVKGPCDIIWNTQQLLVIDGGNAGLTKGGTGDALAGLITAFRATSPAFASVVVSSYINKLAAHELYETHGQMYNTTDLVEQLPLTWKTLQAGR